MGIFSVAATLLLFAARLSRVSSLRKELAHLGEKFPRATTSSEVNRNSCKLIHHFRKRGRENLLEQGCALGLIK